MGGLLKLLGLLVCVLGGWVLVTDQSQRSAQTGQRSFAMGLAYWPAQGEQTPRRDAQLGVKTVLENSEHILVQIPWSPLMKSAPERAAWMAGLANTHGYSLTIAIDWIDEDRKEPFNIGGGNWSFENPWNREQFLSDVEFLASRYKPEFIVLVMMQNGLVRLNPF